MLKYFCRLNCEHELGTSELNNNNIIERKPLKLLLTKLKHDHYKSSLNLACVCGSLLFM